MTFKHKDGRTYQQEITIKRGTIPSVDAACDQLFYMGDEYGSQLGVRWNGGCVICIGGNHVKNQGALLDANKSTYTSVINPVQLIGSHALATCSVCERKISTHQFLHASALPCRPGTNF